MIPAYENERLGSLRHERLVGEAVGGALVGNARPADPPHAYERLDQIVEARRRQILDLGCTHDELGPHKPDVAEMPVVLGPRVVEIGEIAPVVDDALGVGVGEPDPVQGGVLEGRPAVGDTSQLQRVLHADDGRQ